MKNTPIKEAEEQLKKSEERYRLLVEGVKDYAIFMLSPEGYIQSWNRGARELKGYDESEIIGKHFSIFYQEEAKAIKYPEYELEEAIKHGRFEDKGWRVRKDGSIFFANVVITALYDDNNNLLGFAKVTRNLTDRKEAEERLRKSEERYRLLVDVVKDYAIFLLDTNGHIASWNEGAKRLKGYEEAEVLGKHISIFYPEDKIKLRYPHFELEQAAKYGKFEDEGLRIKKDGTSFYANVIITALYSNKELIGFSKITRDLTERKMAEEKLTLMNSHLENRVNERTQELTETVKELKAINADLDNFIYTASHDLKAPLSNIEGLINTLAETLDEQKSINPDVQGLFRMINESVLRFKNTVKDLASVNANQRVNKEDFIKIDLAEVVSDIIASIDHLVKESKADIKLEIPESFIFCFSKIHIRSIMFNLISNAIKYRSPYRPLKIRIQSYNSPGKAHIEVSDNGIGFKEENKDKVFQLFKRLHSHVEGSGIGLYIIKKIADNVGGEIDVTSQADKGTTFKITLPEGKI